MRSCVSTSTAGVGVDSLTKCRAHRTPVALFCYCFAFFYLFRDIVITFGLDGPSSRTSTSCSEHQPGEQGIGSSWNLFLVAFALAYLLPVPIGGLREARPCRVDRADRADVSVGSRVILMLAATVTSTVLAHYGSFGGVVRAAR